MTNWEVIGKRGQRMKLLNSRKQLMIVVWWHCCLKGGDLPPHTATVLPLPSLSPGLHKLCRTQRALPSAQSNFKWVESMHCLPSPYPFPLLQQQLLGPPIAFSWSVGLGGCATPALRPAAGPSPCQSVYLISLATEIELVVDMWSKLIELEWLWKSFGKTTFLFLPTLNLKNMSLENSLVAQWLRIRLPMQWTWVRALGREDPTCRRATKPVRHDYWACEPQLLSLRATTNEAHVPRARAPQQEKPPQWEAHAPQQRVAPTRPN